MSNWVWIIPVLVGVAWAGDLLYRRLGKLRGSAGNHTIKTRERFVGNRSRRGGL